MMAGRLLQFHRQAAPDPHYLAAFSVRGGDEPSAAPQLLAGADAGAAEPVASRAAATRRGKKRQNKPPQRGLGVAQLEKIRMEEQRRASAAALSPPPMYTNYNPNPIPNPNPNYKHHHNHRDNDPAHHRNPNAAALDLINPNSNASTVNPVWLSASRLFVAGASGSRSHVNSNNSDDGTDVINPDGSSYMKLLGFPGRRDLSSGMHLSSGANYSDTNDHNNTNYYYISATTPCPSSTAVHQEPMMELSSFQKFSCRGSAAQRFISKYNPNDSVSGFAGASPPPPMEASAANRVSEMKRPWQATMAEAEAEADIRAAIATSNSRRKLCCDEPPAISSGDDRSVAQSVTVVGCELTLRPPGGGGGGGGGGVEAAAEPLSREEPAPAPWRLTLRHGCGPAAAEGPVAVTGAAGSPEPTAVFRYPNGFLSLAVTGGAGDNASWTKAVQYLSTPSPVSATTTKSSATTGGGPDQISTDDYVSTSMSSHTNNFDDPQCQLIFHTKIMHSKSPLDLSLKL